MSTPRMLFLLVVCAVLSAALWAADGVRSLKRTRRTVASWYGENYRGLPMANGRPFNPDCFTCASWDYALGTRLRVTSTADRARWVLVEVTDRGPAAHLARRGRRLDLSRAAFARLAPLAEGLAPVAIEEADDEDTL